MSNLTLLVTAVPDFLTSREGLEPGTLARSLARSRKLSASIIVALPFDRDSPISESLELFAPAMGILVVGVARNTNGSLASAVSALAIADLGDGEPFIAAGTLNS